MRFFSPKSIIINFIILINLLSISSFAKKLDLKLEAKQTPTREQFKKWFDTPTVPLKNSAGQLAGLNFGENNNQPSDIVLTEHQESSLHDAININFEALCARTFNNYLTSIKKIANGDLKITPEGYRKMKWYLKAQDAVESPDSMTDYELLESYWMIASRIGYSSQHFTGLIIGESFYMLNEIRDGKELSETPNPFPNDRRLCGALLETTSFSWQGSSSNSAYAIDRKLLIADIRYMIKTNVKNLAFPICIRVYWNKNIGRWIPWAVIVYNVTDRYCNIVF